MDVVVVSYVVFSLIGRACCSPFCIVFCVWQSCEHCKGQLARLDLHWSHSRSDQLRTQLRVVHNFGQVQTPGYVYASPCCARAACFCGTPSACHFRSNCLWLNLTQSLELFGNLRAPGDMIQLLHKASIHTACSRRRVYGPMLFHTICKDVDLGTYALL